MIKPIDSDSYGTPDHIFNWLNKTFNFKLDACASHTNSKCDNYFTKENSCLNSKKWRGRKKSLSVFMNPPYSRGNINKMIAKAYEQSLDGCVVVCLVRDDPSTKWYQEYIDGKASLVIRLKERIKFIGGVDTYNFPCCVVIFTGVKKTVTKYKLKSYKEELK